MRIRSLLKLIPLAALVACKGPVLSVQPPSPFQEVASTEIQGAVGVQELLYLKRRSLIFVLDPPAGRVHVLDERMRHSQSVFCLRENLFPQEERRVDQQENCPEGEVAIHRGFLQADAPFTSSMPI
jgi:hypothetical protein